MRNKFPLLSVLPLLFVFMTGCGGSSPAKSPEEVPVVFSMSDQPSGVGVLSFDIQITGACLLTSANAMATSCTGAQNLLPEAPMTVQLENLQSPQQPDVLATTTVEPGSYAAVLITFGSVNATVNVDPHTTDRDSATPPHSCTAGATPTVCELSPALTTRALNIPLPSALALSAGQPVSVGIEFSVANSLIGATAGSTTTFTVTPFLGFSIGSGAGEGNLINVSNVTGPVTDVEPGGFTLTDSTTGQSVTVTPSANATFSGFSGCNHNLSCVQDGQLLTVAYNVSDTTIPVLTASSIMNNVGFAPASAFEGTIVATTPTPMVVVTSVPAGNMQGVTVGEELTLVPPTASSGFSVALPAGQTLPTSVSFASPADLLAGQNVLIDATGVDDGVATSDAIALEPTQFIGVLDVLTAPNLTVDDLNSFFNDRAIPIIQVQTGAQTIFAGTVATIGFNGLTPGDVAEFDGFLFNGAAGQPPVVFGESVFDTSVNVGAAKSPR